MKRRQALQRALLFTGATVSAPLYLSLLSGCKPSGSPTWTSSILTSPQIEALSTLSDLIFPKTETPGASDLAVAECVDLLLTECRSEKVQEQVVQALTAINHRSEEAHGKRLNRLTEKQKESILEQLEREVFDGDQSDLESGYRQLKSLIMLAYFTSEPVMKNQLQYAPIAGRFEGCVDLAKDNRVFVDNNV